MNKFEDRKYQGYSQRESNDFRVNNYTTENNRQMYKNQDQSQAAQSNIVSENSSLVTIGNYYANKGDNLQIESQLITGNNANSSGDNFYINKSNQNQMVRTRNKINVISQNQSLVSNSRNNQSSLNKRLGSVSRGGIRVVSRNSSIQNKSSTSIQKPQTNAQNNNPFCGLNCTTRSPFLQNQATNQTIIVPNLGSIQTLKSQTTNTQLFSDRDKYKLKNQLGSRTGQNFYDNISQRAHIQPSPVSGKNILNHKQKYGLNQNENKSISVQNQDKIYSNVRSMMQNQILMARKLYQKKYQDQIDSLNIFYKSQIETLQRVLGQNQTLIESQAKKIVKLQDKKQKKQAKLQKYQQRFQSIYKFIQSSSKYSIQRLNQVQLKFSILVQQFQNSSLSSIQQFSLANKVQYLQTIFSDLITQTILKYRSIQFDIKSQVKQMIKTYDYFEQKVYQMDLIKHLGKENQIQNYRLIQKIQNIKEQMVLVQSKQNNKLLHSPRNFDSQKEYQNFNMLNQCKKQMVKLQSQISIIEEEKLFLQAKIRQLQTLNQQKNRQIYHQNNIQLVQSRKSQKQHSFVNQLEENKFQKDTKSIEFQRLQQIIEQYQNKNEQLNIQIQRLNQKIDTLQKQNISLTSQMNQILQNQQKYKSIQSNNIQKFNTVLHQKQTKLQNTLQQLQDLTKQKQQLTQALQMTQKMFDQQIIMFKSTIQNLQQQNDNLLQQLQQSRQQKQRIMNDFPLSKNNDLALSKNSDNQQQQKKITLSKSPKKQVCETITMGWFKRNVDKLDTTKIDSQTKKDFFNSPTQKHIYCDGIKEYSSNSNEDSQQPKNNSDKLHFANVTYPKYSKQSFDSTPIMQSSPNIFKSNEGSKESIKTRQKSDNSSKNERNKIDLLKICLKKYGYKTPIECTIDSQNQLQIFQTGIYIVDSSYRPFSLSVQQVQKASNEGIIVLIENQYQGDDDDQFYIS